MCRHVYGYACQLALKPACTQLGDQLRSDDVQGHIGLELPFGELRPKQGRRSSCPVPPIAGWHGSLSCRLDNVQLQCTCRRRDDDCAVFHRHCPWWLTGLGASLDEARGEDAQPCRAVRRPSDRPGVRGADEPFDLLG